MAQKKVAKKKAPAKKATAKKAAKKSAPKKAVKKAVKKAPAKKAVKKVVKKAVKKTAKKTAKKAAKKTAPKKAAKKKAKRKPNPAFMKAMNVSPDLAKIVGSKPQPRTEVTKRVWDYIKKNKLQDSVNKRQINADDNLRAVFGGKGSVTMFEMTKLINRHLSA